jgi:hypothetical protein
MIFVLSRLPMPVKTLRFVCHCECFCSFLSWICELLVENKKPCRVQWAWRVLQNVCSLCSLNPDRQEFHRKSLVFCIRRFWMNLLGHIHWMQMTYQRKSFKKNYCVPFVREKHILVVLSLSVSRQGKLHALYTKSARGWYLHYALIPRTSTSISFALFIIAIHPLCVRILLRPCLVP